MMKSKFFATILISTLFLASLHAQQPAPTTLDVAPLPQIHGDLIPTLFTPDAFKKSGTNPMRITDLISRLIADDNQTYSGGTWIEVDSSNYVYNENSLVSELKKYSNDGAVWSLYSHFLHQYDEHWNDTATTNQSWDGATYTNVYKFLRSYNEAHQVLNFTLSYWIAGAWSNNFRYVYEYNADNHITSYTAQSWIVGTWTNTNRFVYGYNADGTLASVTFQTWIAGAWSNSYRNLYAYALGVKTTDTYQLYSADWNSVSRNTFTYDGSDSLLINTYQTYAEGVFNDQSRIVYTYNADHKIVSSTSQQYVATWLDISRELRDYDASGNIAVNTNQSYDLATLSWKDIYRTSYTYNSHNQTTLALTENYAGAIWSPTVQYSYYYEEITGIETLQNTDSRVSVYPNPFSNTITMSYNAVDNTTATISVYDISGNKVLDMQNIIMHTGSNQITISVESLKLASGVYTYQITCGNITSTGKIIHI